MGMDLSQPAEHNSNHANMKPSFRMGGLDFIMAHQPAMFHKPAKGSFDNPASVPGRKAALVFVPRHDFQAQRARSTPPRTPGRQLLSTLPLLTPDPPHPPPPPQTPAHTP